MAQKSQEQVHFSHATNSSTFSQGTGPYDIKMKTIGVCVWAVNFHFFPDFDVADGTLVQYSVDFPSLFFFPSARLHGAEMLCVFSFWLWVFF